MTFFQIFVGLLLLLSWAGRPFLYKPAAKYFPPSMSPAFTSTWLLIALLLTFLFWGILYQITTKKFCFPPLLL